MSSTTDYLVEMKTTPTTAVLSAAETVALTERFVLPSLELCDRLVAEGRIVAGGPALAGTSLSFIARAESPQQLETLLMSLPIWPRTQTTIVPLGTFRDRVGLVRERLGRLKSSLSPAEAPARN